MTSTFKGGGGGGREGEGNLRQKWDVIGRMGLGVASVLDVQSYFFIKENWIFAITRHLDVSNINIYITDKKSSYWLWCQTVKPSFNHIIVYVHCLRGQFECCVTWFCFYFDFVRSHARCSCCSIVCLRGWRGPFKITRPRSKNWKNFERRWTREVGSLENQAIFMGVICVSSLSRIMSCRKELKIFLK